MEILAEALGLALFAWLIYGLAAPKKALFFIHDEEKRKRLYVFLIWLAASIILSFLLSVAKTDTKDDLSDNSPDVTETETSQIKETPIDSALIAQLKPKFKERKDEFTGRTWVSHKNEAKYRNQNSIYAYFELKDGKPINPRLVIQYEGDDWLFIKDCIILSSEGKVTASGKFERDNSGGRVWEWLDMPLSSSDAHLLFLIANGTDFKMRYNGSQYNKDRTITKKEQALIQETLDYYFALGGK